MLIPVCLHDLVMPMRSFGLCCIAALCAIVIAAGSVVRAEPLHITIDTLIAVGTPEYDKKAAPIVDDAEFLRRVTLDLTGTIPAAAQVRVFLDDKSPEKRAKLIDRLLSSPEYARHLAYQFDTMLMERRADKHVPAAEWQKYLRESFAANKPFDAFVREILTADGADPKSRAAAKFYLDREAEPHLLTRDISRIFLGMNLTCCQCHDHPLVNSYKQDHYYGVFAFLSRSQLFTGKPAALAEKADGETTFTSVFDEAKVIHTAPLRLPNGSVISEPKPEKGKEYKVAPKKGVRSIPQFSRRAQLAPALVASRQFARTTANRLWAMVMGRGLIHPVEFDHRANPPSHPKLLDKLTDELIAHKFDIRYMLKELALSQPYQRSSAWRGEKEPDPERFVAAALKPLTPEQLAWSLMEATGVPPAQRKEAIVKTFVGTFGRKPGEPPTDFQATLEQTLFVSNGPIVRQWLSANNGLATRAVKMNDAAAAEELFLAVLSRKPTTAELSDVAGYLKGGDKDRAAAVQEIVWAMLASVEFRFNH